MPTSEFLAILHKTRNETFFNVAKADPSSYSYLKDRSFQTIFYCIYSLIFIIGTIGNAFIVTIVLRNKPLQTTRNIFVTNISVACLILCVLQLPFTLPEAFSQAWNFGGVMCHVVGIAKGVIPCVLALTLMAITIDRFFTVVYPTKPPLEKRTRNLITAAIWIFAIIAFLPMAIFTAYTTENTIPACGLSWTSEAMHNFLRNFTYSTVAIQFVLPMIIMGICCYEFSRRTDYDAEDGELEKVKRREDKLVIVMVSGFGIGWLPKNVLTLLSSIFSSSVHSWQYFPLVFLHCDAVAMGTVCFAGWYIWFDKDFWNGCRNVLACRGYFGTTDLSGARRLEDGADEAEQNGAE